jgi:hypothetical protein
VEVRQVTYKGASVKFELRSLRPVKLRVGNTTRDYPAGVSKDEITL